MDDGGAGTSPDSRWVATNFLVTRGTSHAYGATKASNCSDLSPADAHVR